MTLDANRPELNERFSTIDQLPDPLPDQPWDLFRAWWAMAHEAGELSGNPGGPVQPNPNAFAVASVGEDGQPSVRMVLCKGMDLDQGRIVFYTNYEGRKGRELGAHPRAAALFYWDHLGRQVRIEGPVTRSPEAESDAYFKTRHPTSRIGAWASRQSEPLESREYLMGEVLETMARFEVAPEDMVREGRIEVDVPRPPNWGGFRLWADRVELWCNAEARTHDRAVWTRDLAPAQIDGVDGYTGGPWSRTRLFP